MAMGKRAKKGKKLVRVGWPIARIVICDATKVVNETTDRCHFSGLSNRTSDQVTSKHKYHRKTCQHGPGFERGLLVQGIKAGFLANNQYPGAQGTPQKQFEQFGILTGHLTPLESMQHLATGVFTPHFGESFSAAFYNQRRQFGVREMFANDRWVVKSQFAEHLDSDQAAAFATTV